MAEHSAAIAAALDAAPGIPVKVVVKPVLTGADEIRRLCQEANASDACIGLVTWMHTFSPAKMWIAGLGGLQKPFLHLHTQFNDEIPWATIDMDFMNLNQAAHGDREFGFLAARLRLERTVVVGHWADTSVQDRIGVWARAASARKDWLGGRIAGSATTCARSRSPRATSSRRSGGSGSASTRTASATWLPGSTRRPTPTWTGSSRPTATSTTWRPSWLGGTRHDSLRDGARIELGLRSFLGDGAFIAFTDTFEDLHGLRQLPGLAVQRLMAEGYGFGAEGDWKTGAMVRAMKVMSAGLPGGASFMEDYTYHFAPSGDRILGAHMLEVCPSIATERPRLEVHPLSIGGKDDPVRLVFDAHPGPAILACVTDMGDRFRMVASVVDVVPPEQPLPRLPVARAMWTPRPNLRTNAAAWILAGGSHPHQPRLCDHRRAPARLRRACGTELLVIDETTKLDGFRDQIRWNDLYHHLARGL